MNALPAALAAKYQVTRALASGGFGTVYLARHRHLDRPVALKLLQSEALSDAEAVDRFLGEARVTASLTHENIVVLLDHGVDEGLPWIAYEYHPATSLRARLEQGRLPWKLAFALVAQVASALAYAHERGVLHRDIKPENVLLVSAEACKVADFGTAKWVSADRVVTQTGVILGTPHYLAPELLAGLPATPLADVYATGVLLYELITGRVPFDTSSLAVGLRARMEREPPPPSTLVHGLPQHVDQVIAAALARSPADRTDGAAALAHALTAALEGNPPSGAVSRPKARSIPPPPTLATRVADTSVKRRQLHAVALATGVALALIAVGTRPPPHPPMPGTSPMVLRAGYPAELPAIEAALDTFERAHARRRATESLLWDLMGRTIEASDPERAHRMAYVSEREFRHEAAAMDSLAGPVERYPRDHVRVHALRARIAGLALEGALRAHTSSIAYRVNHTYDELVNMLRDAQSHPFDVEDVRRVHVYSSRVTDLAVAACVDPRTLDRRTALAIDQIWDIATFLGNQHMFFRGEGLAREDQLFREGFRTRLAETKHPLLAELVLTLHAGWRHAKPKDRKAALSNALALLGQLARSTALGDDFALTLASRLQARERDEH